ncbi:R3H domain-containing protein [Pseudozyma hubeiensis]|nr:R3H domain-containing protein [Pseudozyma hubeiensis]
MAEASTAPAAAPSSNLPAIHSLHIQPEASTSSSATSQSARGRGRGQGRGRGRTKKTDANAHSHGSAPAPIDGSSQSRSDHQPSNAKPPSKKKGRRNGDKSGKANGADAANESNTDVGSSVAAPSRVAARRQQFGGKLTGGAAASSEQAASSSRSSQNGRSKKPVVKVPATAEPVEYADLRSRLLAELSSGEYDCVICYSTVTTRQATWSCSQCYSVLHLPCVRKWAESSVKKAEEHNAMQEDPEIRARRGTWRCPGCQEAEVLIHTAAASAAVEASVPTDVPMPVIRVPAHPAPSLSPSNASVAPRPSRCDALRPPRRRLAFQLCTSAARPAAMSAARSLTAVYTRVTTPAIQAIVDPAPSKWKRDATVASIPKPCAAAMAFGATASTTR